MHSVSEQPPRILIADDQPDILEALRLLLKGEGFAVETARSPAAVLAAARKSSFDVALIDLNYARDTTSGEEGLDLLAQLQALDGLLPVVVMTAWASVELAVEAVRAGARDFIGKPWVNERLTATLKTQVELGRALREGRRLEAENRMLRSQEEAPLIARSPAMGPVLELVARIGPSDANVLVTGENGTGKEVVARALHAVSGRASKPLISVNLGGLSENLFSSELFGHIRGAFTDARSDRVGRFELADGGTLFLDEIATVPLALQPNLLRVLETGEMERVGCSKTIRVDVRMISATNADLQAEIEAGRFRPDLLFRLNTVEIRLPALRDRPEDIPVLAAHFLGRSAQKYRKQIVGFGEDAMRALQRHSWPGNVRELRHVVERAVLLCTGSEIRAAELGLAAPAGAVQFEQLSLEEMERILIEKALDRYSGNVSEAARMLGLSRSALYRRLQKYQV